jgi:hypothetical protein
VLAFAAACSGDTDTDGAGARGGSAGEGGGAGTSAGRSGAGGSTNGVDAAGDAMAEGGASDASGVTDAGGERAGDRDIAASDARAEPDDRSTAPETSPPEASMPDASMPDSPDDRAADVAVGDASSDKSGPTYPADILDLTDWKLTLPIGSAGSPTEIRQPALRTFSMPPYFSLDTAGTGVLFRAHAGGVTTSNSGYPRSELREMTAAGSQNAAWSTTSGTHTITITQTITHLPVAKPHVVAGQIHDASDDVVMVRLEGTNLFVEGGGDDLGTLNAAYTLGTRFTVRLVATGGRIRVYYEDLVTPKVDVARSATDCYFKAGAYTQSNPAQGDDPTAYGEVVIHALTVTHL